ncbi:uncharacterized protein LOC127842551 [Dreissena polymorpha]|uniref:uncharacterized protein LOC127842551 n=1 Tax=Dreissena polymorpha TaxID=45954 RepID=UPI0022654C5F|nr:uncharacterized protein LOC127842551 [Dreissena polymorpha]
MAERIRHHPPMAGQHLYWMSPLTVLPSWVRDKIATSVDASNRFHEVAEVLGYTYEQALATLVRSQGNYHCRSSPTLLLLQDLAGHNCTLGRLQDAFAVLNHPAVIHIPTWLRSVTRDHSVYHSGTQVTEEPFCNCETCNNHNRDATPPSVSGGCGQANCSCLRPPPYEDRPVRGPYTQSGNTRGIGRSTSVEIPNSPPNRLTPHGEFVERETFARALPLPVSQSYTNSVVQTSCCLCDQCRSDRHETKVLQTFDAPETHCTLSCSPTRGDNRRNTNHDIHNLQMAGSNNSDQTQVKSRCSEDLTNRASEVSGHDSDQTQVKSRLTESLINGNSAAVNQGQNIALTKWNGRNSWGGSSSLSSSSNNLRPSISEGSNLSRTSSRNTSTAEDVSDQGPIYPGYHNRLTESLSQGDSNIKTSNVPSRNGVNSPPAYSALGKIPGREDRVSLPGQVALRSLMVFITYSYNQHRDDLSFLRDLEALCLLVRQCGIRIKIDVDDESYSERRINKLDWLETYVKKADYVIACITPTYHSDIQPSPATAVPMESQLNARFIYNMLRDEFYSNHSRNFRMVPVLFPSSGAIESHVPDCMRSTIIHNFPSQADKITKLFSRT